MLMQHDGHRWLRVLTVNVEHSTLIAHAWSQGTLGHTTNPVVLTPGVTTPVLMTPVLTTTVLLHPHGRRAAMEYSPVLVLLLAWSSLPLHFL